MHAVPQFTTKVAKPLAVMQGLMLAHALPFNPLLDSPKQHVPIPQSVHFTSILAATYLRLSNICLISFLYKIALHNLSKRKQLNRTAATPPNMKASTRYLL